MSIVMSVGESAGLIFSHDSAKSVVSLCTEVLPFVLLRVSLPMLLFNYMLRSISSSR